MSVRSLRIALLVGAGLGLVAAVGAGIEGSTGDDAVVNCETYGFDPAQWDFRAGESGVFDGREKQAQALVDCRTLEGKTRKEVKKMLGRPRDPERRNLDFYAGEVNDAGGPSDEQRLHVRFDPSGRVKDASVDSF